MKVRAAHRDPNILPQQDRLVIEWC